MFVLFCFVLSLNSQTLFDPDHYLGGGPLTLHLTNLTVYSYGYYCPRIPSSLGMRQGQSLHRVLQRTEAVGETAYTEGVYGSGRQSENGSIAISCLVPRRVFSILLANSQLIFCTSFR